MAHCLMSVGVSGFALCAVYILRHEIVALKRVQNEIKRFQLSRELLCVPCRRCTSPVGEIPTRPLSLRPEALGAGQEATNGLKHFKKSPLLGGQRGVWAVTRVNTVQAPK